MMKHFLFTISCILLLTGSCSPCSHDDYQMLGAKCVKFVNQTLSFDDALSYCNNEGSDLLSIFNADENSQASVLLSSLQKTTSWLGLNCSFSEDTCEWYTGYPTNYTNFVSNDQKPDLYRGDCFYLKTGFIREKSNLWMNDDCEQRKDYFICEEPVQVPTCGDYHEFNEMCYNIIAREMNFNDSEAECINQGGHLASVDNKEENNFIVKLIEQTLPDFEGLAWIGLIYENGTLFWTDETKFNENFTHIPVKSTPKDGDGFAFSVLKTFNSVGDWYADVQSTLFRFVCKREKAVPVTSPRPSFTTPTYRTTSSSTSEHYSTPRNTDGTTRQQSAVTTTFSTTKSTARCPQGREYLGPLAKCIELIPPLPFDLANKLCAKRDGQLISVHSGYDESIIEGFLDAQGFGDDYELWIGAQHPTYANQWEWTDTTPFNYFHWLNNDDSAQNGRCGVIRGDFRRGSVHGWSPRPCETQVEAICVSSPIY